MTRSRIFLVGVLGAAAAGALTSCGDNSITAVCGDGTTLLNGECIADGSVICGDGTVLDEGECVASDEVCGAGTVFVDGECLAETDPEIPVDAEEGAEPNGLESDTPAGEITVPAIG